MMQRTILFGIAIAVSAIASLQSGSCTAVNRRNVGPVTIFRPPSDYRDQRTLYGRVLQIKNGKAAGTLLTTWESYSPVEPVAFPIYQSHNNGATWSSFANVTDQKNHYGNRYQPFLYELPSSFGKWSRGTVFLAGNSIPSDLSTTQIVLYVSTDHGRTWSYISTVATGGKALPNNGLTPVWEPFLILHDGQLICYYSDQRDPKYGQKLVHQTTKDGYNWSNVVNDVTSTDYGNRPGMPIVSKMGNGQYVLTYENLEAPEAQFAAYYKISQDPLAFGKKVGRAIKPRNAAVPSSSPYNVWTPQGGKNGTLIANAGSSSDIFINQAYGEGEWLAVKTEAPASYSRSLAIDMFDDSTLFIVGGGPITGNGSTNAVRFNSLKLAS